MENPIFAPKYQIVQKLLIGVVIVFVLFGTQFTLAQGISIIPKPNEMTLGKGNFNLDSTSVIWVESDSNEILTIAEMLQNRLNEDYGMWLPIVSFPHQQKKFIAFVEKPCQDSEEAYKMEIAEKSIYISANASNGLFYGLQSL